jgi:phosphonate transport system substrate-binding protein
MCSELKILKSNKKIKKEGILNTMKKLTLGLTLLSTFALAACGVVEVSSSIPPSSSENTSSEVLPTDPATINIQFVPSNSSAVNVDFTLKMKALESLLEERIPEHKFKINVGVSYAATIEAMLSEQVHVAFLTSQQYAFVTTEHPGKVEVLLTSVRDAYAAQIDSNGEVITDKAQIVANVNSAGYTAALDTSVKVASYYSMLLTKTESSIQTVADLAGKTVITQAVTSGSGYVYPAVLLHQNGLKFVPVTSNPNPDASKGEVAFKVVSGHQNSINAMMNNEGDAVFTFLDARSSSSVTTPFPNIFTQSRVVALTNGIYNDTISAISSLSTELKEKIQEAFIDIIGTEVGASALSVYNHTGYLVAKDEDYAEEREVYVFKRDNLS